MRKNVLFFQSSGWNGEIATDSTAWPQVLAWFDSSRCLVHPVGGLRALLLLSVVDPLYANLLLRHPFDLPVIHLVMVTGLLLSSVVYPQSFSELELMIWIRRSVIVNYGSGSGQSMILRIRPDLVVPGHLCSHRKNMLSNRYRTGTVQFINKKLQNVELFFEITQIFDKRKDP